MNIYSVITFMIFTYADILLACPGCAGSTNNQADNYTVYVLIGFILAIYVPFYLLFKTVFKYRNLNRDK